jgi:hypothetical protein
MKRFYRGKFDNEAPVKAVRPLSEEEIINLKKCAINYEELTRKSAIK